MGFVSAASLLVAGCSPHPCGGGACPTATFDLRVLNDSSVAWSFRGSPPQTLGVVPYPSSSSDCSFDHQAGYISPTGDAGADKLLGRSVSLQCEGTGAGRFNVFVSHLGDFRDWPAGTFMMRAPAFSVGIEYSPSPSEPTGTAAPPCGIGTFLEGIVLTVTVETATGGRAPYPKLVTDDFVRTFRLDFDTTSVEPRNADGVVCDFALAAQVSLHLTQTAADYVYDADAPCICE